MSGLELCRRCENIPYPNLKVVMMSGRADPDEMARMLLNGANDFIVKRSALFSSNRRWKQHCSQDAQDRADLLNSHLLAVNRVMEQTPMAKTAI